ncbi:homocysteine S-methyltransferase family protein [Thermoleophilia bacterium SCSIO 60948]|nr:homocysteine S-methyltransferase family protein [Thermoleophilia bacterium SCSIO 60948]
MEASAGRDFRTALTSGDVIVTDGGIETRIMFETDYELDPDVQVAAMVGDPRGRALIREVYASYVRAAERAGVAIVIGTPTFRASRNFAVRAGLGGEVERLNREAAEMHAEIRATAEVPVYVAGVLGPARDAYTPGEAPDAAEAATYHAEQAEALAASGVDLLFAATFPAVAEATGAGRAMAATGLPAVVSLVLGPDGAVLDGTPLGEAVAQIDSAVEPRAAYLSLSCIHTSLAERALAACPPEARDRILELKANGSPLPTEELVKLDHPVADPPDEFAARMWDLHDRESLQVLGGCCGTTVAHIEALAGRIANPADHPAG